MSCPNCIGLRNSEQKLEKIPYSLGRRKECTTKINKLVPRCFSCEINPAPANKNMACRGCMYPMGDAAVRCHNPYMD